MNLNFTLAKARDFDVVILKENGWINYTKLCKDLTGKSEKFRRLIIDSEQLHELIKSYESKLMTEEFLGHEINVTNLVNCGILKSFGSIQQVKNKDYVGTYGPRYMLDFIIMTCNISYYKFSKLLNFSDKSHLKDNMFLKLRMFDITSENKNL